MKIFIAVQNINSLHLAIFQEVREVLDKSVVDWLALHSLLKKYILFEEEEVRSVIKQSTNCQIPKRYTFLDIEEIHQMKKVFE